MSYLFAGFFAESSHDELMNLPPDATLRRITEPFTGIGIRIPSLLKKTFQADDVVALASNLGIAQADRWLFIQYACWGGQLDFVYGLVSVKGEKFGPVEESDLNSVRHAYTSLMEKFGVLPEMALRFPPFVRGYWGET